MGKIFIGGAPVFYQFMIDSSKPYLVIEVMNRIAGKIHRKVSFLSRFYHFLSVIKKSPENQGFFCVLK